MFTNHHQPPSPPPWTSTTRITHQHQIHQHCHHHLDRGHVYRSRGTGSSREDGRRSRSREEEEEDEEKGEEEEDEEEGREEEELDDEDRRKSRRIGEKQSFSRSNLANRSTNERLGEASSPAARSHKRRRKRALRRRFVSDEARTLKSRRPARHAAFPLSFLRLRRLFSSLLFAPLSISSLRSRSDDSSPSSSRQSAANRPRRSPTIPAYRRLSFIRFVQSSPILRIALRPHRAAGFTQLPCPPNATNDRITRLSKGSRSARAPGLSRSNSFPLSTANMILTNVYENPNIVDT